MELTATSSTNQVYGATNNQKGTVTLGDGLGKDSFLQLLITQMRYQDPLEPASDTEYLAQLAQFNALEQMQNLNDKFDKMLRWSQMVEASSLIGKQIDAIVAQGVDVNNDGKIDTSQVNGVVDEVKFVDGEPRLIVAGKGIALKEIVRIYPQTTVAISQPNDNKTNGGETTNEINVTA